MGKRPHECLQAFVYLLPEQATFSGDKSQRNGGASRQNVMPYSCANLLICQGVILILVHPLVGAGYIAVVALQRAG